MFAVNTYQHVEEIERSFEDRHIVILLFVRPSLPDASNIINEFDYIHYNSERYCSIYAVGYSNGFEKASDPEYRFAGKAAGLDWYYSNKSFVEFKNKLEYRLKWRYSGEIELLVLQNNPGGHTPLNFQNYVAIDVNRGIKEGYVDSFYRLMESLIRYSKNEVTATEAFGKAYNSRIKLRTLIEDVLEDCKQIPTPIKKILKDRLFYKACIYKGA